MVKPERVIRVGSQCASRTAGDKFMLTEGITIPPELHQAQEDCHEQGETMIMVAFDEQYLGSAIPRHGQRNLAATQVSEKWGTDNLRSGFCLSVILPLVPGVCGSTRLRAAESLSTWSS